MSKELRELHETIAIYALEHSVSEIPRLYFDNMVKTWHDMNLNGHDWDKSKAAASPIARKYMIHKALHKVREPDA